MKEIYNQIIENTKKISAEQDYFSLPKIENAKVTTERFRSNRCNSFKKKIHY